MMMQGQPQYAQPQYAQPQYAQPMQTQQPMQQSFMVVYPQGIAWRSAPNYNARVTNVAGPAANTMITGPIVMGQDGLQYVQVGNQFIPMSTPQGQQLLAPAQMQQAMAQDLSRVQQSYAVQQPGYAQGGMMHGHGKHDKKMYKKQKKAGKYKKGYKIKLF